MMRNIVRVLAGLAAVLIVGFVWLMATVPPLPEETDRVIDEVLAAELPELVTGETGTVMAGDISIWYERIPTVDPPRGTVLLIMGAGSTALGWPSHFYQPLIEAGYEVLRFDHRGTGMSDWMADWDPDDPYDLEDLALDALAILDGLGVERAHVVGVSMGGMIAQRLAISHGDRVASLTSISSSGYEADPELPNNTWWFVGNIVKLAVRYALIPSDRGRLKLGVGVMDVARGNGEPAIDIRRFVVTDRYEATQRKGINSRVARQHMAAVEASGSRYDELGSITVPTLVVHGRADPVVDVAHAERYAPLIPEAELLLIDRLGHILPAAHTPRMIEAMLRLFATAEHSA